MALPLQHDRLRRQAPAQEEDLEQQRERRQPLDLDLPEVTIELDAQSGAPVQVSRRSHDPGVQKAYRIVEELKKRLPEYS